MQQVQDAEEVLTIQQMVRETGLSAHTLRYYERAGLMRQLVGRDDGNGYRAYTWQHVSWVKFIKRLRTTGMPIRDIQRYTQLLREGDHTIPERIELLKQHKIRVQAHLEEVASQLTAITAKIEFYEHQAERQVSAYCAEGMFSSSDK